jgi:polar amino acid transport system substrate-binding protein
MKNLLFCVFLVASAPLSAAVILSIRADEWSPINRDPTQADLGVMIELAKALAEPAGYTVEYKIMDWEKSLQSAGKGETGCVVGANASEAAKAGLITPKLPWARVAYVVFAKPGKLTAVNKVTDLSRYKIGVSYAGENYDDDTNNYVKANLGNPSRIYLSTAKNRKLRDLITRAVVGQIDGFIEGDWVGMDMLRRAHMDGKFIKAAALSAPDDLFIACSKAKADTPSIIKIFDDGFPKMRKDGRFAAILAKYGLTDWQQ